MRGWLVPVYMLGQLHDLVSTVQVTSRVSRTYLLLPDLLPAVKANLAEDPREHAAEVESG